MYVQGRAHKERSGFEGPWTPNPLIFDNSYFTWVLFPYCFSQFMICVIVYAYLYVVCFWTYNSWNVHRELLSGEKEGLLQLPTDKALLCDPVFRPLVDKYAAVCILFVTESAYMSALCLIIIWSFILIDTPPSGWRCFLCWLCCSSSEALWAWVGFSLFAYVACCLLCFLWRMCMNVVSLYSAGLRKLKQWNSIRMKDDASACVPCFCSFVYLIVLGF